LRNRHLVPCSLALAFLAAPAVGMDKDMEKKPADAPVMK
jgi:hypothetical protein